MDSKKINFDRKIMIMQRNGVFFAGKLMASFKPVVLQELDILLLSFAVNSKKTINLAEEFISTPIIKILYPVIQLPQILNRIEQLIKDSVLIESTESAPQEQITQDFIQAENDNSNLNIEQCFRLGTNFALQSCQGSFAIWSPKSRKYLILDKEFLLLLLSFASNIHIKNIIGKLEKLINAKELKTKINFLILHGLIVKDIVSQKQQQKKTVSFKKLTQTKIELDSWKDIKVDGRIPVYFVPHMENHYPLALGMIFSALKNYQSGELIKKFILIPICYLDPESFLNGPYRKFGKGVWLFSNYMWSIESNIKISEIIKRHLLGNLTIHGGPSTPDYEIKSREFFDKNKSVDICVHGEGEASIIEIFDCLQKAENGDISYQTPKLKEVNGITFRNNANPENKLCRTQARTRLKDPDQIPSPYNMGYFDSYDGNVEAAIIETNRGCPFGCTFCDWGSATNQKIRKFELERVKSEIEWIAKKGVRVLWIADANFGMYDRDIEVSEFIVKMKNTYNFPREIVVNYTKNTTWRLAEIIKIFSHGGIISQGIISIQTTDTVTLEVINRQNIKTKKYDELSKIFRDLKLPLSTDLMLGLPGITVDAFQADLQRYFDLDVSVKAYPTQLLPNSPMAAPDYIEKYKIEVDQDDFLISTYSYTQDELNEMKALYNLFTIADGYSLLRYVLRFLQWEHNIKSLDFLNAIRNTVKQSSVLYPKIVFAFRFFETDKIMPGGWKGFYDEIAQFAKDNFGIERDSTFNDVLLVNEAAMPDESCQYPISIELNHNFEDYFLNNRQLESDGEISKLASYLPSSMSFDDPDGMSNISSQHIQYDSHQFFWEIRSSVARAKSAADFE